MKCLEVNEIQQKCQNSSDSFDGHKIEHLQVGYDNTHGLQLNPSDFLSVKLRLFKTELWSVQEVTDVGAVVGDCSGDSQKPLYSKLSYLRRFKEKSPFSKLRPLPSYIPTKVASGVTSKGSFTTSQSGNWVEES